jgi:group I intron endonuclease
MYLVDRISDYLSASYLANVKGVSLICRAILAVGIGNFTLKILCYCDPKLARVFEQSFMLALNPAYNIAKDALAPMFGRKHSEEAKAKIGKANLGNIHSEEAIKKMTEAKIGNTFSLGKTLSAEIKEKISKAQSLSMLGNQNALGQKNSNSLSNLPAAISVQIIDTQNNNKVTTYSSMNKAAKSIGTHQPVLSRMSQKYGNIFSWKHYVISINK